MSISVLPAELIKVIIDNLSDDSLSLRSFALTCKWARRFIRPSTYKFKLSTLQYDDLAIAKDLLALHPPFKAHVLQMFQQTLSQNFASFQIRTIPRRITGDGYYRPNGKYVTKISTRCPVYYKGLLEIYCEILGFEWEKLFIA